ncbi:MAG: universal stress protein [Catenulispora sp.]|nr:universal stress protein [Catenulispora sp.]
MSTTTVVVGYDESVPSEHALLMAAEEARLRQVGLTVVHAYHYGRGITPMGFTPPAIDEVYKKVAVEIAEQGVEHVRARYPDLDVRTKVDLGPAARVLVAAAGDAALLVVGNRGRGGFAGLLLGSVSMRVLGSTPCPVIVARGENAETHDRVVVAVDIDDPGCADVLAFAFDEAARRDAELVALHVWDDDQRLIMEQNLVAAGLLKTSEEITVDLDECLSDLVSHARTRHPEVGYSCRIAAGAAGKILVGESEHADLVVAGARRRHGAQPGLRIGPVATTLLHHAGCPVAVVPHS